MSGPEKGFKSRKIIRPFLFEICRKRRGGKEKMRKGEMDRAEEEQK